MSDPAESTPARKAYEAYRDAMGPAAFDVTGQPYAWDGMPKRVQEAFRCAAYAGHAAYETKTALELHARQVADLEKAWAVIAHAYGGDWDRATPEWRGMAERFHDQVLRPATGRTARESTERVRVSRWRPIGTGSGTLYVSDLGADVAGLAPGMLGELPPDLPVPVPTGLAPVADEAAAVARESMPIEVEPGD